MTGTPLNGGSNPLYSTETLQRMYACMVECRDWARRPSSKRSRKLVRVIGREAIEVATAVHLRPEDTIVAGGDWSSSVFAASPLSRLFKENGRSSPTVIAEEAISVARVAIATGVAAAHKVQAGAGIVVLLAEKAVLESKACEQAIAYAGEGKLPIIYVIERNLWAEAHSIEALKPSNNINVRAARYGLPAIPVDGADTLAVYRVAQEAIARARKRGGPTLVECHTFRWFGHSAVNPARYRSAREVERWSANDPIVRMKAYLQKRKLLPGAGTGVGQQ